MGRVTGVGKTALGPEAADGWSRPEVPDEVLKERSFNDGGVITEDDRMRAMNIATNKIKPVDDEANSPQTKLRRNLSPQAPAVVQQRSPTRQAIPSFDASRRMPAPGTPLAGATGTPAQTPRPAVQRSPLPGGRDTLRAILSPRVGAVSPRPGARSPVAIRSPPPAVRPVLAATPRLKALSPRGSLGPKADLSVSQTAAAVLASNVVAGSGLLSAVLAASAPRSQNPTATVVTATASAEPSLASSAVYRSLTKIKSPIAGLGGSSIGMSFASTASGGGSGSSNASVAPLVPLAAVATAGATTSGVYTPLAGNRLSSSAHLEASLCSSTTAARASMASIPALSTSQSLDPREVSQVHIFTPRPRDTPRCYLSGEAVSTIAEDSVLASPTVPAGVSARPRDMSPHQALSPPPPVRAVVHAPARRSLSPMSHVATSPPPPRGSMVATSPPRASLVTTSPPRQRKLSPGRIAETLLVDRPSAAAAARSPGRGLCEVGERCLTALHVGSMDVPPGRGWRAGCVSRGRMSPRNTSATSTASPMAQSMQGQQPFAAPSLVMAPPAVLGRHMTPKTPARATMPARPVAAVQPLAVSAAATQLSSSTGELTTVAPHTASSFTSPLRPRQILAAQLSTPSRGQLEPQGTAVQASVVAASLGQQQSATQIAFMGRQSPLPAATASRASRGYSPIRPMDVRPSLQTPGTTVQPPALSR
eukprot:TRINITY_DN90808_c0_g1_i1.p1 TRINITY_DN90808_c0_g1~~TRINITY_DN90808_c0_g1_i1.p1  ORF type:complete len:706 (+),score=90.20 TRINITY_DN90808_c0_g1_i1:84-2201(+)